MIPLRTSFESTPTFRSSRHSLSNFSGVSLLSMLEAERAGSQYVEWQHYFITVGFLICLKLGFNNTHHEELIDLMTSSSWEKRNCARETGAVSVLALMLCFVEPYGSTAASAWPQSGSFIADKSTCVVGYAWQAAEANICILWWPLARATFLRKQSHCFSFLCL